MISGKIMNRPVIKNGPFSNVAIPDHVIMAGVRFDSLSDMGILLNFTSKVSLNEPDPFSYIYLQHECIIRYFKHTWDIIEQLHFLNYRYMKAKTMSKKSYIHAEYMAVYDTIPPDHRRFRPFEPVVYPGCELLIKV